MASQRLARAKQGKPPLPAQYVKDYTAFGALPTLSVDAKRAKIAIPAGQWNVGFPGAEALLGGLPTLDVSVHPRDGAEVALEIPAPVTIKIHWGDTDHPQLHRIWISGGTTRWQPGQEGVMHLVQDSAKPTQAMLHMPMSSLSAVPAEFQIFPGVWTVHCQGLGGKVSKAEVNLPPGSTMVFSPGTFSPGK